VRDAERSNLPIAGSMAVQQQEINNGAVAHGDLYTFLA